MQRYEVVREIFNLCSGNQMRDVFIDEVGTDDPLAWLRSQFAGKKVEITLTEQKNDTLIYEVMEAGLRQRYSFTAD